MMIEISAENLGELQAALEQHPTMSYPAVETWAEELMSQPTFWSVGTEWPLVRELCDKLDISYEVLPE